MGAHNRGYLIAGGLAVLGALAMGQGMRGHEPEHVYRDFGGPKALWHIPDGTALPDAAPVRLEVSEIGLNAKIMRVGQNKDGTVEVPPFKNGDQAGWYEHGPAPGTRGSAVVLGHYDDQEGPAVFYKLNKLKPGAQIRVQRSDKRTALFRVDATEQIRKWEFPRTRVYGDVHYAGLRLITCGGDYNRDEHSYKDNFIVYAHLVGGR
ncbi:class F sortase [Actinomadura barringtoniae]|uniref:Class F sortase n=1 Tax=Actinomadura barringtoniae TaxID=1427535 RepID=A0A939T933_9ACTN|nr:class F sortase [Actinomadura barringtoniae]MBO2447565.1 class F sortase [Actinomadura barringtoniae]